MAKSAMIVGVISLGCPLTGVVAIILGIIAIVSARREPNRYRGKGMAIAGVVCGGIGTLVTPLVFLPSLIRARELSKRLICSENLKAIGLAADIYLNDTDLTFVSLKTLVVEGFLDPRNTSCPSATQAGPNYVILEKPAEYDGDPEKVVAYEPKSNHGDEGGNILFADGHVEFVKGQRFDDLLAALPP